MYLSQNESLTSLLAGKEKPSLKSKGKECIQQEQWRIVFSRQGDILSKILNFVSDQMLHAADGLSDELSIRLYVY